MAGPAINIRVKSPQKLLIDKAAKLLNKTRSEFMLESACNEAMNVLLDRRLFILDDSQFEVFTKLLDSPVTKNHELNSLLDSKSPWEK